MEKPISLRKETWDFLLENFKDDIHTLESIEQDNPFGFGPTLFKLGIIDRPDLLQMTVIELDDDAEYLLDGASAEDLFISKDKIHLIGLGNEKKRFYLIARDRVINAIKIGPTFDQLEQN